MTPPHGVQGWRYPMLAFGLRAWEACLAGLLLVIGLADLIDATPVPPELEPVAPEIIFHIYGLYLSIGAVLVLAAIFFSRRVWARRAERAGMLLLAGATGSLIAVIFEWFTTVEYRDPFAERIAIYLLVLLVLTTIGSLARWFALRHPLVRGLYG